MSEPVRVGYCPVRVGPFRWRTFQGMATVFCHEPTNLEHRGAWMLTILRTDRFLNRSVKALKGISVGVVTLLCFVLIASPQSAGRWKPLFNSKDFSGWTAARGGSTA